MPVQQDKTLNIRNQAG